MKAEIHNILLLRYVTLSLLILWGISANAQFIKYDFDIYNTKDGLSYNNILSIAQDKKGFIWLGTANGLNRFDGHDFKVFKHQENNPNSIINNNINSLFVDDDGSIWIGTNNGICRYHPDTEFVEHFPIDFTDNTKLNGAHVTSIQKEANGSIWVTYIGSGIDVIKLGEADIFHYTIHREDEFKLQNDLVTSLILMQDGNKLVGTFNGLQVIDKNYKVLTGQESLQKYPWIQTIEGSI